VAKPYLHCHHRFKNGKDHCSWSIAEKVKTRRGWVQRHLLYLGEINDSQKVAWTKATEVFDPVLRQTRELALYPATREVPEHAASYGVQVRLEQFSLHRPRQWGACWVACQLWDQLQLDEFWGARLADSREGTCWRHVLQTLTSYRLIDPAANGACTGSGSITARWPICWRRISVWRPRITCIGVWISCSRTVRNYFVTCGGAGRISSGSNSRCCFTI
jgi:hypothetical protein